MFKLRTYTYNYIPPLTRPLVLIADSDKVVITIIIRDMKIIKIESNIPACPTIHGILKNNITPQILSRHEFSTPSIQPNFIPWFTSNLVSSS